ncbi:type IV pilus secretin PilQ [Candidatus Pelagibacter sp.]|mgnify:CR=1 FL=1|nr:type IV pilus secretin PilQ [Candidatus Pelagibacter sp.]|tara:strand:+ start:95 stop:1636 length:1542 start_codon:yes stop_codon:yes gene_type:complete
MNIKNIKILSLVVLLFVFLNGCTTAQMKSAKKFKHNTPLIKNDVKKSGQAEVDKTVEMGPKPVIGDTKKLQKRKKISSQQKRNYLLIPDEFQLLKQTVTFNFKNLDYSEAMKLMAKVGDINILVGDEVKGSITAELVEVPWDKAFNALLDMKNFAADIDVSSNLIRVHSPSTLTAQENYKSTRAAAVKKKVELEDSVEPIVSEIFRLYYISPAEAKTTINELFATVGGESSFSPIQITEETTTRSIIVRGKSEDLDVVDKIIKEIDVRTKQVLIEAFIVEADSTFEQALGTRLGGAYNRKGKRVGGTQGASTANSALTQSSAALGGAADSFSNFEAAGKTSGIGILRQTGSAVLKAEISALESLGLGKTISNPKVFTLDNQVATITQGEEIQFQATGAEGANTSFKEAALKLQVTPSIIGDGNVLLDVSVNNDSVNRAVSGEPGINKMEIVTKLLIADGDIVVIGGIKKNKVFNTKDQTPGLGNVPVLGNLFKGKTKSDSMDELLIFIAPRIL